MKKFIQGMKVPRPRRKVVLIGAAIVLALLLLGAGGSFIWYQRNLQPLNAASQEVQLVTIRNGLASDAIGDLLEEKEIVRSSTAFNFYTSRKGVKDKLKAGTYELSPNMKASEIVDKLVKGDIAKRTVTFAPGRRLDQLEAAMVKAGFDATAVKTALDRVGRKTLAGILPEGATLEGYLYAETYIVGLDDTPEDVIALATAEFVEQLTPEVKAGIEAQGLTVHEAVILASIVQQESSKAETQKQIAQVFIKRLREGIALGADPTYKYAAAILGRPESTTIDSPYNTRLHKGLPPGPIGNFGKTALQAVAFPAEGDYLFFVAGRDCITRFSRTNQEHEALKAQYGVAAANTECAPAASGQ